MKKHLVPTLVLLFSVAWASAQPPKILKIDPPNWYATLPKPMLLVRGENLTGATFSLSDTHLHIDKSQISANGHWAELWLSASPDQPETIQIEARTSQGEVKSPFTFARRRAESDGMKGFSNADTIYLIMTDRFADGDLANDGLDAHSAASSPEAQAERANPRGWHGGDLRGIAQHLDYLQSLGVTTVWTTPVYRNREAVGYHGYHATDYYAVDEHYGTLADLQSLVQSLHARGMKLLLDTVPNHAGPFHPWVQDEPTPNWFHGTASDHLAAESNFRALIDPHTPPRDRLATLTGWFVDVPPLPDMNTDDPTVAQYLRQNAVWWLEQTGADGLRIDTFPYVDRPFWHAFHAELHALYPHLTEVGEVSNGNPEVTSAFAAGVTRSGVDTGLYTPFDFPFYHAARDVFANGAPFTRLADILSQDALYPHPERLVPFLGNHDEARFAQTVTDPALLNVAYALLLTSRGTPQIYAGDELAMPGGGDPDNRRDFPGGFPGSADAFTAAGRTPEQEASFTAIQRLMALRRAHPALMGGEEQILHVDADTFVYLRTVPNGEQAGEQVLVALNKSSTAHKLTIVLDGTALAAAGRAQILMGEPGAVQLTTHTLTLELAAKSIAIAKTH